MSAIARTPDATDFTHSSETPADELTRGLYELYASQVYSACLRALGSREEAEDALQETYLRAWSSLARGTRPHTPRAWLLRIAENACISRHRSRRARIEPVSLRDVDFAEAPESQKDELFTLSEALGELSETERLALVMREWRGFSYDEIARELGLSNSAVASHIHRGRRRLAACLDRALPRVLRDRVAGFSFDGLLLGLKSALAGHTGTSLGVTVAVVASAGTIASGPFGHDRPVVPQGRTATVWSSEAAVPGGNSSSQPGGNERLSSATPRGAPTAASTEAAPDAASRLQNPSVPGDPVPDVKPRPSATPSPERSSLDPASPSAREGIPAVSPPAAAPGSSADGAWGAALSAPSPQEHGQEATRADTQNEAGAAPGGTGAAAGRRESPPGHGDSPPGGGGGSFGGGAPAQAGATRGHAETGPGRVGTAPGPTSQGQAQAGQTQSGASPRRSEKPPGPPGVERTVAGPPDAARSAPPDAGTQPEPGNAGGSAKRNAAAGPALEASAG